MPADLDWPADVWKLLGAALIRRRHELGFASRAQFVRANRSRHGMSEAMIIDVENAERHNFDRRRTFLRIEQDYQLAPGAVEEFLSARGVRRGKVPVLRTADRLDPAELRMLGERLLQVAEQLERQGQRAAG